MHVRGEQRRSPNLPGTSGGGPGRAGGELSAMPSGEPIQFDRRLLGLLQEGIPLVRRPYARIAEELGCTEAEVLAALERLRGPGGLIREISGIFDASALGYQQALIALRVPPRDLRSAGYDVAGHPGVSHCYGRDGPYNLWFTLAVSPRSRLGLTGTVARLAEQVRAEARLILPALRRYKLDARFGPEEAVRPAPLPAPAGPRPQARPARAASPSPEQVRAISALQMDLPTRPDPFAPLASAVGMDADMLLVHAADFLAAGWMRRYAAGVFHRRAGAESNVMVVWKAPEDLADIAGARFAASPAVSHCYLRATCPGWDYNLYTMIHGQSPSQCARTIAQLADATGLTEHLAMWTVAEYKKRRVRLFTGDEAEWECRRT